MRRSVVALTLVLAALLLSACGGGGSSTGAGSGGSSTSASGGDTHGGAAKTPEQVWAKEVEGVMRKFENTSANSVTNLHTHTSKYTLEPTYATYSDELAQLGKELEATHPPAACEALRERMGVLAKKVSQILGVLGDQPELSPEEYVALTAQQRYKFASVGRRLTNATIYSHC
jgi:ABC-type glycerol-3-phosphate transport system substrate-binding protein